MTVCLSAAACLKRYVLYAEILREAFFYFTAALFQLIGIRRQKLQLFELRFIRGIGHVRMASVKAFLVGEQLLRLFRENILREKLRGVWMRRVLGDGDRRDHQRHSFFRIDDLDGISLF